VTKHTQQKLHEVQRSTVWVAACLCWKNQVVPDIFEDLRSRSGPQKVAILAAAFDRLPFIVHFLQLRKSTVHGHLDANKRVGCKLCMPTRQVVQLLCVKVASVLDGTVDACALDDPTAHLVELAAAVFERFHLSRAAVHVLESLLRGEDSSCGCHAHSTSAVAGYHDQGR
jgi:hypothetical protein